MPSRCYSPNWLHMVSFGRRDNNRYMRIRCLHSWFSQTCKIMQCDGRRRQAKIYFIILCRMCDDWWLYRDYHNNHNTIIVKNQMFEMNCLAQPLLPPSPPPSSPPEKWSDLIGVRSVCVRTNTTNEHDTRCPRSCQWHFEVCALPAILQSVVFFFAFCKQIFNNDLNMFQISIVFSRYEMNLSAVLIELVDSYRQVRRPDFRLSTMRNFYFWNMHFGCLRVLPCFFSAEAAAACTQTTPVVIRKLVAEANAESWLCTACPYFTMTYFVVCVVHKHFDIVGSLATTDSQTELLHGCSALALSQRTTYVVVHLRWSRQCREDSYN